MVPAGIVGFSDAHGVVCKVDIAVVAWMRSVERAGRKGTGLLQKSEDFISRAHLKSNEGQELIFRHSDCS